MTIFKSTRGGWPSGRAVCVSPSAPRFESWRPHQVTMAPGFSSYLTAYPAVLKTGFRSKASSLQALLKTTERALTAPALPALPNNRRATAASSKTYSALPNNRGKRATASVPHADQKRYTSGNCRKNHPTVLSHGQDTLHSLLEWVSHHVVARQLK